MRGRGRIERTRAWAWRLGLAGWLCMVGAGAAWAGSGDAWPPLTLSDVSGAASAEDDSLRRHPDRVAQRVRIEGVAPGAAGRTVRWRVDADPLSGLDWEIDAARIAADGTFSLRGMFRETMPTTLAIDYYEGTLFVSPGTDYRLRFDTFDYGLADRLNVWFPGAPVPPLTFDITRPAAERLNHAVWDFLTLYGEEIDAEAYEAIAVYGQPQAVLRLRARVDSLAADTAFAEAFASAYVRYRMAGLEEFARLKNGKALFRQYLKDQPLLYRNPAQMQFVRSYFGHYFDTRCPIPEKRLKQLLAGADVQTVLDTLGVDSLLVNRQWREWVYIQAVSEALGRPDYPAEALLRQLAQLSERTAYPMHRQTIAGLLEQWRRRHEGIRLAPYVWTDMQGRAVAADTLLGAAGIWTYVCIVKSDPALSPEGSSQIYALQQALWQTDDLPGRGLVLVCDDDSAAARTYARALQASLQPPAALENPAADRRLSFYHFNREIGNLKDWEVYTFPAFVVISPEGRIYPRFAAPVPDGLAAWRALMKPNGRSDSGSGRR